MAVSEGTLVETVQDFDELIYQPILARWAEQGPGFRVSLDSETTRIDRKRGFNPFYGPRVAMGSLSWDDENRAFTTRMRPGLHPIQVPRSQRKALKPSKAAFRAAYARWKADGELEGIRVAAALEPAEETWLSDQLKVSGVQNIPVEHVIARLNDLTERGIVWVMKNMKFDLLMYAADGFVVPPLEQLEDAEVQSHLTEQRPWQQGRPVSHSLQPLAERHLKRPPEGSSRLEAWFEAMGVAKDARDYSIVPKEILAPYAWQDTRDTLDLYWFFDKKMSEMDSETAPGRPTLRELYRDELKLIRNLVLHTITPGFRIDQAAADAQLEKYTEIREQHVKQLDELSAGANVDWGSPAQVASYLFDSKEQGGLGYAVPQFAINATGRSSAAHVLEQLDTPITRELLSWRKANTFIETFLEPIARFNVDGFVHPDFHLTSVRTGRMSGSHPNMQNRPKDPGLRAMWVPRDGYVLVLMDLDQIEMRLAGHFAYQVAKHYPEIWYRRTFRGRETWCKSVAGPCYLHEGFTTDPTFDPHQRMVDISGLPRKSKTAGEATVKNVNFARLYGVGIPGMMRNYRWEETKARQVARWWDEAHPEVVHLQAFIEWRLSEKGFIANEFGRRYYTDRPHLGRSYLIQGCAGDLFKRWQNRIYDIAAELREAYEGPTPLRILNMVHDESVMELREDLVTLPILRRINAAASEWRRPDGEETFTVPITASCEIAERNWGDAREFSLVGVG